MQSFLFGASPFDPLVLILAAAFVFLKLTLAAAFLLGASCRQSIEPSEGLAN